ncbi:LPXTG cell wall anchor domain-containing protein [Clostridium facile]|uniref:LPXTG cell wall anchor domain-containing protein n=1 Tax=Clostridium facile TaxID=2763035 RepID=A0ABR7INJ1_9CLOT|nr:LPXTG cell wall anchor domain-containing protein [Clostridium facile]MBC5786703.1 LPXTG cell wall anchor domain-containing protein [Clostridium facile]
MKKLKKMLAGLLTVAMVTMIGATSVGAVEYNSISNGTGGIVSADVQGGTVTLNDTFETAELQKEVDQLNTQLKESLSEALGIDKLDLFSVEGAYEGTADINEYHFLTKIYNMDLDVSPAPTKSNPVNVDFICNTTTSNIDVFVLHKCAEDGWELLNTTQSENKVTAAFHSASPVALVYVNKGTDGPGSTGTSPQTGDNQMGMLLLVVAAGLATSGVVFYKKYKNING